MARKKPNKPTPPPIEPVNNKWSRSDKINVANSIMQGVSVLLTIIVIVKDANRSTENADRDQKTNALIERTSSQHIKDSILFDQHSVLLDKILKMIDTPPTIKNYTND